MTIFVYGNITSLNHIKYSSIWFSSRYVREVQMIELKKLYLFLSATHIKIELIFVFLFYVNYQGLKVVAKLE